MELRGVRFRFKPGAPRNATTAPQALIPVLIGAAVAVVLAALWWRFSARPASTPVTSAPVVATTAAPSNPVQQPAPADTSQPADRSTAPAPPKKEPAPRLPVSKSAPSATSQPAQSQPPPVAA